MTDSPSDDEIDALEADLIVELIRDTVTRLNSLGDQLESYASERDRIAKLTKEDGEK